jgi:hypothetical protein
MIQVLANPEKFEGKHIVLFALLDFDSEAVLLFLSKEDYDNVILPNTLWVQSTEEMYKNKKLLNLKYVRIDGTFSMRAGAGAKSSIGGISDIRSCTPWSDPGHPAQQQMNPAETKN